MPQQLKIQIEDLWSKVQDGASPEDLSKKELNSITKAIDPAGVAVVLEATHHCMTSRGVQKSGTKCRTAVIRGVFEDSEKARAEFMFHLSP